MWLTAPDTGPVTARSLYSRYRRAVGNPRMYNELASWFHLVSDPAEYADEAADILRRLADHGVELGPVNPDASVLELGSGGGSMASHLKARAHLTLTDLALRWDAMFPPPEPSSRTLASGFAGPNSTPWSASPRTMSAASSAYSTGSLTR